LLSDHVAKVRRWHPIVPQSADSLCAIAAIIAKCFR
jgi:hypothetical protein